MKIGIVCAMDVEARRIREAMKNLRQERKGGIDFLAGNWLGHSLTLAVSGVGKVNAAMAVQTMILCYAPSIVVNTGVAGAIDPGLKPLDVVLGERVVQHDVDTTALGDPPGMVSGIDLVEIPCPAPSLAERLGKLEGEWKRGLIASGDQFVGDREKAEKIGSSFGALAVDMESGSVGQVCYINSVECLLLRAISDGGDGMEYTDFVDRAAQRSVEILEKVFRE